MQPAVPHIVLVAGYDYGALMYGTRQRSFRRLAERRLRLLRRRGYHGYATLFDVAGGAVLSNIGKEPGASLATIARYTAVSPRNYVAASYSKKVFAHYPRGVLSILDVYAWIDKIGRGAPGTLVELGFFCHGWVGGPSLVNSDDRKARGYESRLGGSEASASGAAARRAPHDKDGRRWKDFRPPTMSAEARVRFAAAFAPGGAIWNWSCASNASAADVLYQLTQAWRPGTRRLHFAFSPAQAERYFAVDRAFFPADVGCLSFTRSVAATAEFLRGRLRHTYSSAIAVAAGVPCYGALCGTYADYEIGAAIPLMVVPRAKPPYLDDFSRHIDFYTHEVGVELDPEGRGFGKYAPEAAAPRRQRGAPP